jgi:hypothetical protein
MIVTPGFKDRRFALGESLPYLNNRDKEIPFFSGGLQIAPTSPIMAAIFAFHVFFFF